MAFVLSPRVRLSSSVNSCARSWNHASSSTQACIKIKSSARRGWRTLFLSDPCRFIGIARKFSKNLTTYAAHANAMSNGDDAINPLLSDKLIEYGLPDYNNIRAEHAEPAMQSILTRLHQELDALEKKCSDSSIDNRQMRYEEIIPNIESILDRLTMVHGVISHLSVVRDSEKWRTAVERSETPRVEFMMRIAQSKILFQTMKQVLQQPGLSDVQQRLLELLIRDATLTGVGLEPEDQQTFNTIQEELSRLSIQFSNNVLDAKKSYHLDITNHADVNGIPPNALELAAFCARSTEPKLSHATQADGPWRFTLAAPSFTAFIQYGPNRSLREQFYREYVTQASSGKYDNTLIMARILYLETQAAVLLNYNNAAEMLMATRLLKQPQQVQLFLEDLRVKCMKSGQLEFERLQAFAREHGLGKSESLRQWDVSYYDNKLLEETLKFQEETLRKYLPFERCLKGMFNIISNLFNVLIEEATKGSVAVWHPDVRFFNVFEKTENCEPKLIAGFFLDPFVRPDEKRSGAWFCEQAARRVMPSGRTRMPIGIIVCNQEQSIGTTPAHISWNALETLFHETGHCLNHLLSTVNESLITGIRNVAWDAVELPSQFMEHWTTLDSFLDNSTSHVETGEPLPMHIRKQLKAYKQFGAATQMLRQIRYAMCDMSIYADLLSASTVDPRTPPSDERVAEIAQRMLDVSRDSTIATSFMAPLDYDRYICSFLHIFGGGYSAGYYSYKYAEVMSDDAFSAFEEAGLQSDLSQLGKRFRDEVLAVGGSRDAGESFRKFRGRDPSIDPLLKHAGILA